MRADLHIHTTASDGKFSPREIYEQAKRANLQAIAITDHDTVDGLLELFSLPPIGITIIPGVELNTDTENHEVHILGYHIDTTDVQLIAELDKLAQDRFTRVQKIIDKLTSLGFPIEYDYVLQIGSNSKSLGRPHIAKALIDKGYFSTMDEVFNSLLNKNAPAYVPHYKLTPEQAIKLIQAAGGIAVLAHPGLVGSEQLILDLIKYGLNGLEVYHPVHTEDQINHYLNLAASHNLKITGGSDYHGIRGRFPEELGEYTIPATLAEKLRDGQA